MHGASSSGSGQAPLGPTPMNQELAKVVAYLAQTNPEALPAVLSALGTPGTVGTGSVSNSAPLTSTTPTGPNAPAAAAHSTPIPAAPNDAFYTEGTLRQPNSLARADTVPRFDLQSASNIRAGWAASRGVRKSTVSRSSMSTADVGSQKHTEQPKGPTKVAQVPLAKDHAVQLKNQPPGPLLFVPNSGILSEYAPWTPEKHDILRGICRRRELLGYPVLSYGMTSEEVRREVAKCLPEVPELANIDYVWMSTDSKGENLYNGVRAHSTSARNLDKFFDDDGLMIITPMVPIAGAHKQLEDFEEDWIVYVAPYELKQARKSTDEEFRARVFGSLAGPRFKRNVQASPANARTALERLISDSGNEATPRAQEVLSMTGEGVAAPSSVTERTLGPPLTLSDTSDETTLPMSLETTRGRFGPPIDRDHGFEAHGSPGNGQGLPVDLTTPSTRGKRTPRPKRTRIELSPFGSTRQESMTRLTRNSARAGFIDNAASAGM